MSLKQRLVTGAVATALLGGGSIALFALQAPSHEAGDVQIVDRARVLQDGDLLAALEDVRFYQPTDVVVFTTNGGAAALTDDNALNDEVLAHARTQEPEWLSPDGTTFADDLFILGVDPQGRLVGTYFGENRSVPQNVQTDIQEATKPDFRAGAWTDGVVAGVTAAADRMNQPGVRGGSGAVPAVTTVLVGGGSLAVYAVGAHRAGKARRAREEADAAYAAVVRDHEATEVHADLLPHTRYGAAMRERVAEYRAEYEELTATAAQVAAIPSSRFDAPSVLPQIERFRDRAVALDRLDDVIVATATFLNLSDGWGEVWARESAALRDDLAALPSVLGSLPEESRDLPEVAALHEVVGGIEAELGRLGVELEARTLPPDDALDRLRSARDGLTAALEVVATAVAQVVGRTDRERDLMESRIRDERSGRRQDATILSTGTPGWAWYSVLDLGRGVSAGSTAVERSRAAASSASGGSSSSFSSSGGGSSFSGSGSSSRF